MACYCCRRWCWKCMPWNIRQWLINHFWPIRKCSICWKYFWSGFNAYWCDYCSQKCCDDDHELCERMFGPFTVYDKNGKEIKPE